MILIALDCFLRYQTNYEFETRWFRENTTGAVKDLGHGIRSPKEMLGELTSRAPPAHTTNHWTLLPLTTPVCTPHPTLERQQHPQ